MRCSSEADKYEDAQRGFHTCMACLKELSEIFWHAEFYHDFFELLATASCTRPAALGHSDASPPPRRIAARQESADDSARLTPHKSTRARSQPLNVAQGYGPHSAASDTAQDQSTHNIFQDQDYTTTALNTNTFSVFGLSVDPSQLTTLFPNSQSCEDSQLLSPDEQQQLFNGWLDDDALLQSLFPSA